MNYTTKTLLVGCTSLFIVACNKPNLEEQSDKTSQTATQKKSEAPGAKMPAPNFVKGTVSNQKHLSLDVDFENESEDQINKENYKEKLDAFEKESDKSDEEKAEPLNATKGD